MNRSFLGIWVAALLCLSAVAAPAADKPDSKVLYLIPFPKQVSLTSKRFAVKPGMLIRVSGSPAAKQVAQDISSDLAVVTGVTCAVSGLPVKTDGQDWMLCISPAKAQLDAIRSEVTAVPSQSESYALSVTGKCAVVRAKSEAGLIWGEQALRQLVRANMTGRTLPGISITDWPSLRYRGFQDDMTRGESSTLQFLQKEVRMGSLLKMNFWTYYMENQYAFKKHPTIGPKGGSMTPEELKALADHAGLYGVDIVGNQQSLGHMEKILEMPEFSHLAESPGALDPTNEETYQFLDDLYSEVAPLTTSKLFNVCCDEVWQLGTGKAKELTGKIGVGGVYTQHMRRVHDLLRDKYGKRMMMWGDIILQHPESLNDLPKDTIMLSWGYDAAPSFDNVIKPFANAGYDFFVCPGVSCWFRILPMFDNAVGNIQGYVRDGAKYGALGMLNTSWDDGAENLFNYNWHGVAWGAECSWNASATSIDDFDRRIGGVLFGEKTDDFGEAIKLLAKTDTREFEWMSTPRFWQRDTLEFAVSRDVQKRDCQHLLTLMDPALEHLKAAKKDAKFNADVLDYFIFGADRMKLLGTRMLRHIEAAESYEQAGYAIAQKKDPKPLVDHAIQLMKDIRADHAALKPVYCRLYLAENKAYSLDWLSNSYDDICKDYDRIISKLVQARDTLDKTGELPPAAQAKMEIVEKGVRRTRPQSVSTETLVTAAAWHDSAYRKRVGITVSAGNVDRRDQPVEVDLPIASSVSEHLLLVEVSSDGASQKELPCQVTKAGQWLRLSFLATGAMPKGTSRSFLLYYEPSGTPPAPGSSSVTCTDDKDGRKWIENEDLRLLIAPEGGHIYRWEVKAQGNRDITEPGETEYRGFADVIDAYRNGQNKIEVLANGPAFVRVRCTNEGGLEKTITAWAGVPWVEVLFNRPVERFWCYDDAKVMGPDSPTPGTYLFSDGETGLVKGGKSKSGVQWGAKYVQDGLLEAVLTPEEKPNHIVGPGGGTGGVGVEGGSAAHFVIYGGLYSGAPKDVLGQLRASLDYRNQPSVSVYAAQSR